MKYAKGEARRIVLNCAKRYQQKLENKKLLIVYRERRDNKIYFLEVVFHGRNYQHLTGLELIDENGNVLTHQSNNFYRKCIENKLSTDEIQFKKDGTTFLKLQALPSLTDVTKITKITGDYNGSRPYLCVDKVIGGVNFCLGLDKEDDTYVPSSALLEDIKKISDAPSQVLAIFEKKLNDPIYKDIKHVAKGINLKKINLPEEVTRKICLENYVPKGI